MRWIQVFKKHGTEFFRFIALCLIDLSLQNRVYFCSLKMCISFARVLKLYFLFIELLKFPSLLFYRDYTETWRTTETISIQIIAWLEQITVLEIFQAFERKKACFNFHFTNNYILWQVFTSSVSSDFKCIIELLIRISLS